MAMAEQVPEAHDYWRERVRAVSKAQSRETITDAHDVGGLSYQEIADELGVSRLWAIKIVGQVRRERGETTTEDDEL